MSRRGVFDNNRADDTVVAAFAVFVNDIYIIKRRRFTGRAGLYRIPSKIRQYNRCFGLTETFVYFMSGLLAESLNNLRIQRFSRRAAITQS